MAEKVQCMRQEEQRGHIFHLTCMVKWLNNVSILRWFLCWMKYSNAESFTGVELPQTLWRPLPNARDRLFVYLECSVYNKKPDGWFNPTQTRKKNPQIDVWILLRKTLLQEVRIRATPESILPRCIPSGNDIMACATAILQHAIEINLQYIMLSVYMKK